MPRASSTDSPLVRPATLLHQLAKDVQEHISMPDPSPLYFVLGVLAANMQPGNNVWGMLVGSSSCGKTTMLNTIKAVDKVHITSTLRTPAALISGTKKKERAANATGGLLRQIGPRGLLGMVDFTGMLSLDPKMFREMVGAFRDICDGFYNREMGTDGGVNELWNGAIGFLGCTTGDIDSYHTAVNKLGPRWIYYRFPDHERGFGAAQKAMQVKDKEKLTDQVAELVRKFIQDMCLTWSCFKGCKEIHQHSYEVKRDLDSREENRIESLANITVKARSFLPRHKYKENLVVGIGEEEKMARITGMLSQLLIGFEMIGMSEEESWSLLGKVAADSAPKLRLAILGNLMNGGMSLEDMSSLLTVSMIAIWQSCVDMQYYGLVELDESKKYVTLTTMTQEAMSMGWNEYGLVYDN